MDEVVPQKIEREAKDIQFKIKGQGFDPIDKGWWPFYEEVVNPVVRLTYTHQVTDEEVLLDLSSSKNQGTSMLFMMPGGTRKDAKSPVAVTVVHDGLEVDSPDPIEIEDVLEITSLRLPNSSRDICVRLRHHLWNALRHDLPYGRHLR